MVVSVIWSKECCILSVQTQLSFSSYSAVYPSSHWAHPDLSELRYKATGKSIISYFYSNVNLWVLHLGGVINSQNPSKFK